MRIVEREEFRHLCLLLRPELKDKGIPHRTTMYKRILETCEEELGNLSQHIQVILGHIL